MDVGAAKMGAETSRYVQTRIFLSYPQSVMSVVCVSHRPLPNREAAERCDAIADVGAKAKWRLVVKIGDGLRRPHTWHGAGARV